MNGKDLLLFYGTEWKKRYGRVYPYSFAKEGAQFKRLLTYYSAHELQEYVSYYIHGFVSSFADGAGHSVGCFVGQLSKIISAFAAEEKKSGLAESHPDLEAIEQARKIKT